MTTVPGRLTVDPSGRVRGAGATIHYNEPFPCVNHGTGSADMNGVVMHTMVGNLPGTVATFNDPAKQVSAFFGIDQSGLIHQFLRVGKGEYSWAQEAGNEAWYSIEHADNGNTENPLTPAQIVASAQVVECLSAFAGFPLQVTDSVTGHGYGTHVMGGAAWGGHTCPGPGPRAAQRLPIIELAKKIRAAATTPDPFPSGRHTADGTSSLAQLAQRQKCDVADIWNATIHVRDEVGKLQRPYLNAGDWSAKMPNGMVLWLP